MTLHLVDDAHSDDERSGEDVLHALLTETFVGLNDNLAETLDLASGQSDLLCRMGLAQLTEELSGMLDFTGGLAFATSVPHHTAVARATTVELPDLPYVVCEGTGDDAPPAGKRTTSPEREDLDSFVNRIAADGDDQVTVEAESAILRSDTTPAGLRRLAEALAASVSDSKDSARVPRTAAGGASSIINAVADQPLLLLEKASPADIAGVIDALVVHGHRVIVTAADPAELQDMRRALRLVLGGRIVDELPKLAPSDLRDLRRLLATYNRPANARRLMQQLPSVAMMPSVSEVAELCNVGARSCLNAHAARVAEWGDPTRRAPEQELAVDSLRAHDIISYAKALGCLAAARKEQRNIVRKTRLLEELREQLPMLAAAWAGMDGGSQRSGFAWFAAPEDVLRVVPLVDAVDITVVLGAEHMGVERALMVTAAPRLIVVSKPDEAPYSKATLLSVLRVACQPMEYRPAAKVLDMVRLCRRVTWSTLPFVFDGIKQSGA